MTPDIYLEAIQPDLNNVCHLFGIPDSDWETGRFSWSVKEESGAYICRFTADGQSVENRAAVPEHPDERLCQLHRKRACRRLVRQTLYDLLRRVTGLHPAWGSLTGVRPTRLYYEGLESGLTADEAERRLIREFDVTP